MIGIVPFSEIDNNLLIFLKDNLKDTFREDFIVLGRKRISLSALDRKRNQYQSLKILNNILNDESLTKYNKILAVIDKDLYTDNLNFIFGQAQSLNGRVCIISLKRLYPEFYNLPKNEYLFKMRTLKEATHELGHLYGLGHCRNIKCVMSFSNMILEVDNKESQFCLSCKRKLK